MKTPEPARAYPPKLVEPPAPEEREAKILPRYVEIPALREHGFGPRNLFWGVVTLFIAIVLLLAALFFAGPKAAVSLTTALLTFTALFVLSRLHIFRQRNGGFFALAIVCLLGAAVPLVESGFEKLNKWVARAAAASAATAVPPPAAQPPLLSQSFALPPLDDRSRRVKVLQDSIVPIADRSFLIKAGDEFPFVEKDHDEVIFAVQDLRVQLPAKVVDVLDPTAVEKGVTGGRSEPEIATNAAPPAPPAASADDLAAITISAQREAIRRYPALGIKNSLENEAFVSTYQQLKEAGSLEFFSNPEWPIELAELLAKRESWARGGPPATTGPASVLETPRDLPSVDTLDAGSDLPGGPGAR